MSYNAYVRVLISKELVPSPPPLFYLNLTIVTLYILIFLITKRNVFSTFNTPYLARYVTKGPKFSQAITALITSRMQKVDESSTASRVPCIAIHQQPSDHRLRIRDELCLKFVKIREFYEIFKIRKKIPINSFYNINSNCNVFDFAHH